MDELSYGLWDANQLPAYEQCAADFHKANPDITVKVEQLGWDDYWNKINTGFVSGATPTSSPDHLGQLPRVHAQQADPAAGRLHQARRRRPRRLPGGPGRPVEGADGKQYGLPKDFDTVALFYNKQFTDAAGLTAEQLATLDWNPEDGGSYEAAIAHLTVDKNGVRGDEPGFDKNNVATYGLWLENSGGGRRPDPVELPHPHHRLGRDTRTRGARVQLRRPQVPGHHRLVVRAGREGLHAQLRGHRPASAWPTARRRQGRHRGNGSWMTGAVFGYKGTHRGHRPHPGGPERQARLDVQRPGRQHLGRHQARGRAGKWVEYLGFQPTARTSWPPGRRLPRHHQPRPTRPRRPSRPRTST